MPIYKYRCDNNHVVEDFCSTDKRLEVVQCTECSKIAKRIFSISLIKVKLDSLNESLRDRKTRYDKITKDKKFGDR